jgi:carbon starvation protein
MSLLWIAAGSVIVFLVAYHTYGRWLRDRIFKIDATARVPSEQFCDNIDYVPTSRSVVFGHHFTSIAGTGPIVGPAVAVFWGWLPALLWIVLGSIFIGAVHDFGALVLSLRNRGKTVGEIAGQVISPRTRVLFLLILFFALLIVLAIFGLVIATIFKLYPGSVLGVWISFPLAMGVGYLVHRRGVSLLPVSLICLVLFYAAVYVGVYHLPIRIPDAWNPVLVWTAILFVYCFFASTLPVWLLLQPRDFLNSHQLLITLVLLFVGMIAASFMGASLVNTTPAIVPQQELPKGAPPLFPFLFITIACGAVSGFHCLVSSGTTSKQLKNELDAQPVGYGGMLLEGFLAVVVVLACCAGVGMGLLESRPVDGSWHIEYAHVETAEAAAESQPAEIWRSYYNPSGKWSDFQLGKMVGAFVNGGANFLNALGIPLTLGVGLISVLVACFAATTLDSATRLQRYVVQELATTMKLPLLENKYSATLFAVVLSGVIAAIPSSAGAPLGSGGLILWPLFGAINQLLAGLALMVVIAWLYQMKRPVAFAVIPLLLMLVMPFWAMTFNVFSPDPELGWAVQGKWLLVGVAIVTLILQIWMVIEFLLAMHRLKKLLHSPVSAPVK